MVQRYTYKILRTIVCMKTKVVQHKELVEWNYKLNECYIIYTRKLSMTCLDFNMNSRHPSFEKPLLHWYDFCHWQHIATSDCIRLRTADFEEVFAEVSVGYTIYF